MKTYLAPEIELKVIANRDVLCTSREDPNETPMVDLLDNLKP